MRTWARSKESRCPNAPWGDASGAPWTVGKNLPKRRRAKNPEPKPSPRVYRRRDDAGERKGGAP